VAVQAGEILQVLEGSLVLPALSQNIAVAFQQLPNKLEISPEALSGGYSING
jgi:hypothetical protein